MFDTTIFISFKAYFCPEKTYKIGYKWKKSFKLCNQNLKFVIFIMFYVQHKTNNNSNLPMQSLAPALNGKYPNPNFDSLDSSKNLSGMNSFGFGYKSSLR